MIWIKGEQINCSPFLLSGICLNYIGVKRFKSTFVSKYSETIYQEL